MQKSRTIFIWDVHWCYKELKLLLKRLKIKENDKVYFVWDMINKWPDSYKVINFIYKNRNQFKCIKWNNEVNFLKWIKGEIFWNHKKHKIYKKLIKKINKKPELLEYIRELPLYIEGENFTMIHWWLIPNKLVKDHTEDEITRIRQFKWKFWYDQYKWNKKIIYWHNAIDWLQIREKTIWIDSWCVYWKSLTAYILETEQIYSQNALDVYLNVYKKDNNLYKILKNIFKINNENRKTKTIL